MLYLFYLVVGTYQMHIYTISQKALSTEPQLPGCCNLCMNTPFTGFGPSPPHVSALDWVLLGLPPK